MVTIDLTTNPTKGVTRADSTWPVPRGGLDRALDERLFLGHAKAIAQRVHQLISVNEREARW